MEDLIAHLTDGHTCLTSDTPIPERVYVPWASLVPLSLVHPLMVSPFLAPSTAWHMTHTKSNAMGMTQRVAQFLDLLRVATVDPQKGIAALTSVYLADANLAQRQGIRTILAPLPPPPQPPSQILPLQQPFQMQAMAPPLALMRQAVTSKERWGAEL